MTSSVLGFHHARSLVDVVVVIAPPKNSGADEQISKIVLQNIKVLANGQNIDKPKNDREVERVKAVTLQVTPEQAEKLALAGSEGKLQLVMRNSVDQADEQTAGANKQSLLSGERATIAPEPGMNAAPKRESSPRRYVPRAAAAPRETPQREVSPGPIVPERGTQAARRRPSTSTIGVVRNLTARKHLLRYFVFKENRKMLALYSNRSYFVHLLLATVVTLTLGIVSTIYGQETTYDASFSGTVKEAIPINVLVGQSR